MKIGKSVVNFKQYNNVYGHKLNTNPIYYALYIRKTNSTNENIGNRYNHCNYTKNEIIILLKQLKQCDIFYTFDAYPRVNRCSYNRKKYLYEYNPFTEWFTVMCGNSFVCNIDTNGKLLYVTNEFKSKVRYFRHQFFTRDKDTRVYKLTAFAQQLILDSQKL